MMHLGVGYAVACCISASRGLSAIAELVVHARLQVSACMRETEKLGSLLSSRSPLVATFIPTSVFVRVDVRTSVTPAASRTHLSATAVSRASNSTSRTVQLHLVTVTALVAGFVTGVGGRSG